MLRNARTISLSIAVIVILLVVYLSGLFTVLPQVAADGSDSKISSDIFKAISAMTGKDVVQTGRVLQGLEESSGNITVFIYMNSRPNAAQIAEMELLGATVYADSWIPPVGAHPRGYLTATVPAGQIYSLAQKVYVLALDYAEKQSYPMNDVAATTINAQSAWYGKYTGAGVRVAVLDDGLDITHPDLPTPVFAKDYWQYPIIGDDVVNPVAGGSAHGTHVSGSVLGRGTLSSGKYKGIAYGADLVFLKIGNNTTGSASAAAMNNALKDAVDLYKADIISMSYGSWSSHHDGTDANCQAADYAVSKGAVVLISAGNTADDALHYSGTVNAGGTTDFIQVNVQSSTGSNCTLEHNLVWYDGPGVRNELMLQYYDASKKPILTQYWAQQESTRGTERRQFNWGVPPVKVPAGNRTYYIKVSNGSTSSQAFHIYFEGLAIADGTVKFASPDIYYTVGSPGDADSVICVGSYNSRQSWFDYSGVSRSYGFTPGEVTVFSSRGPRVDPNAPVKPTFVAPGSVIISCRDRTMPLNAYTVSNSDEGGLPADYYAMQGTSMATPLSSGATALLLQSFPSLRGKQAVVRSLWQKSASRASQPDNSWGYGLINIQRAMAMMNMSNKATLDVQGNEDIVFQTSSGGIANAQSKSVTENLPQGYAALPAVFPYGLFSFDFVDLEKGGSIDVTITLPQAGPTEYWICTQNGWVEVPVIALYGNTMIIRLTDGGPGDGDNMADGDITDFGGPALGGFDGFGISTQNPQSSASTGGATTTQPVSLPNVSVQSASLSATHADKGEVVEIRALVSNMGRAGGDTSVRVYVNGVEEENLGVTVAAGQTVPVRYMFSRTEQGVYTITVNNIPAGTVIVEDNTTNTAVVLAVLAGFIVAIGLVLVVLVRRFRVAR